jgi:hypothetical protein
VSRQAAFGSASWRRDDDNPPASTAERKAPSTNAIVCLTTRKNGGLATFALRCDTLRAMLSRAVAALVVFALLGPSVAPCAGWQTTPQAREDCCAEGQCPHEFTADPGRSAQRTQAEADQCCAAAERKHQQGAAQSVDAAFVLSQAVDGLPAVAMDVPPTGRTIRRHDPVHPPPTPLHVLFSVFLV